ncbi:hypothetical protein PM082_021923 [Marasmius tenuissimus]|nr:hypothetical protein PM082_021923 [Marasmius tenuissimus]
MKVVGPTKCKKVRGEYGVMVDLLVYWVQFLYVCSLGGLWQRSKTYNEYRCVR